MTRRRVGLGERGRVPFALVGVLLVVTSALYVAGITRPSRPPEPGVDVAMERTTADARATLRGAVAEAGVAAASDPVTSPADTPYGQVLDENETFRSALKLRIYLTARERFASVGRTHRDVRAGVSLPATPDPAALERAIERVAVSRAGPNGTRLNVTVRGIEQTAWRNGRTVASRNRSLTVRVASPVLAVHDRVTEFERKLDADLTEPGLGQMTTARLYAVTWARGYAQYNGAPIENVLSNRHVSLVTNGGVLQLQRSVFGRSDPDGRRAHARALGAMVLTEAMGQVNAGQFAEANSLLQEQVRGAAAPSETDGVQQPTGSGAPAPEDTIEISVGRTADHAFTPYTGRGDARGVLDGFGAGSGDWLTRLTLHSRRGLDETIDAAFEASVRTVGARDRVNGSKPPPPGRPDAPGEWSLADDSLGTDVAAVASASGGPPVAIPSGYHTFYEYERLVTLDHERVRTWRHNGSTAVTTTSSTERMRVSVAVVGRHVETFHAPSNPVETVHEPAGPFDGPNLANVTNETNRSVVAARGGLDGLAGAAARDDLDESPTTIQGEWPAPLREWAYRDLVDLRGEVRELSVEVERGRVGTFETNPQARLLAKVRARRGALLDAPPRYDHVADAARVELRAQYLHRVEQILERKAALRADHGADLNETLSEHTGTSLPMLRRSLAARRVETRNDTGDLRMTVDGAPPYLTLTGLGHDRVSAVQPGTTVHPLVAENVNVATVPYGDATDTVLNGVGELLTGTPQTRLRTGVDALDSVESAHNATGNDSLAADRSQLQSDVNESIHHVRFGIRYTLADHGVGGPTVRREVVTSALARWETDRARALAVSNRSVVEAVVEETDSHPSTNMSAMELDQLRLDLRDRVARSLDTDGVGVSGPTVSAATKRVKNVLGDRVEDELTSRIEDQFNRSIERMPAGIPLLPPVSAWYATTNIWVVTVEGRYERFAVEAPRRTPAAADASLAYVRDGDNVSLDVDDDGTAERIGHNEHVSFEFRTAVVVVVPSGRAGVGDIDGNMQERSPGWPLAGPESHTPDRNSTGNRTTGPPSGGYGPGAPDLTPPDASPWESKELRTTVSGPTDRPDETVDRRRWRRPDRAGVANGE